MTILSAADVTRVADAAFAACLIDAGFVMQKPRHWIRATKSPLHELIELGASRIGYMMEWGIGAVFVPLVGDDRTTWEFKQKQTTKTSRIDFHLGPTFRNLPNRLDLEASKFELVQPVVEYALGVFKRQAALPNLPNFLADEVGIQRIVRNGCSDAIRSFETISRPEDVLLAASADYEKSLTFPPSMLTSYWLSLGLYEIACGNDQRGAALLDQSASAFNFDLTHPVVQESIAAARGYFVGKAA